MYLFIIWGEMNEKNALDSYSMKIFFITFSNILKACFFMCEMNICNGKDDKTLNSITGWWYDLQTQTRVPSGDTQCILGKTCLFQ